MAHPTGNKDGSHWPGDQPGSDHQCQKDRAVCYFGVVAVCRARDAWGSLLGLGERFSTQLGQGRCIIPHHQKSESTRKRGVLCLIFL